MAGITVSHLSFTYPQETVSALRDVSFTVEEGEFLTLIGPSGGGKSTLLRALKPALTPHGSFTGEISFFGEPLSAAMRARYLAIIAHFPASVKSSCERRANIYCLLSASSTSAMMKRGRRFVSL